MKNNSDLYLQCISHVDFSRYYSVFICTFYARLWCRFNFAILSFSLFRQRFVYCPNLRLSIFTSYYFLKELHNKTLTSRTDRSIQQSFAIHLVGIIKKVKSLNFCQDEIFTCNINALTFTKAYFKEILRKLETDFCRV